MTNTTKYHNRWQKINAAIDDEKQKQSKKKTINGKKIMLLRKEREWKSEISNQGWQKNHPSPKKHKTEDLTLYRIKNEGRDSDVLVEMTVREGGDENPRRAKNNINICLIKY